MVVDLEDRARSLDRGVPADPVEDGVRGVVVPAGGDDLLGEALEQVPDLRVGSVECDELSEVGYG